MLVIAHLLLILWGVVDHVALASMLKIESQVPRKSFLKVQRSDPQLVHELVFAVQQSNLDRLDNILMSRSTPGSVSYQKWLSFDEVTSLTMNQKATHSVLDWLVAIDDVTITWRSMRSEYIKAEAPIEVWEKVLEAEFFEWHDQQATTTARKHQQATHRALEYSLPAHIAPHLAAVFNTVQVPPVFKPKYRKKDTEHPTNIKANLRTKQHEKILTSAPGVVTVPFLNELYKISSNTGDATQQQSVFETAGEDFSPEDLTYFQETYNLPLQAVSNAYGHDTTDCVDNDCYEGNLDVQYIMGIAQQTETVYWYTTGNDPFVAWITEAANTRNPPLVNSISWGIVEQAQSKSSLQAFNTEALKLAAMGVTITVSSGDDGAASEEELCNEPSGSNDYGYWAGSTSWSGKGYFPSFPASSPYVTAVGATMGPENGLQEVACQSQLGGVITSGGGFSTYYPTPSWQTAAVAQYFASLPTEHVPTDGYNNHGRAYPDVSLIGVWYQTYVAGTLESVFGTSASAPVFAAMISLINAQRAALGKPSLGFLNPTLYLFASEQKNQYNITTFPAYNDVTSGNSRCMAYNGHIPSDAVCCDSGFYASTGWDPVTGLGSINFANLTAMFENQVPYELETATVDDDAVDLWTNLNFIIIVIIIGITLVATILGGIIYAICMAIKARNGSYAAANRSEIALTDYAIPSISLHAVDDSHSAAAPPIEIVRNPLAVSVSSAGVYAAPPEHQL